MRILLLMLAAGLVAGCSYSPEEQYRECMRESLPVISDNAEFVEYDAICKIGAGMEPLSNPYGNTYFSLIIASQRGMDALLEQFQDPK